MHKPPAFQLYTDDIISGTSDMTAEELGIYIRLLCHAWNKHGLKNDAKRLTLLVGECAGDAAAMCLEILEWKFELGADGIWRNARQEEYRQKLLLYRTEQSTRAKDRWQRKKAGAAAAPVPPPEKPAGPPPLAPEEMVAAPGSTPEANVPAWEEIKAWAAMDGVPEAVAREFFDHENAFGQWKAGRTGGPINARNALKVWFNRGLKLKNGTAPKAGPARPAGAPSRSDVEAYAKQKWPDEPAHLNWAASFYRNWNDPKRNWQRGGRLIDWQIELGQQVAKWRTPRP